MSEQCSQLKSDGSRCRGQALKGESLCAFHSPKRAAARAEGRRRGGKARARGAVTLPSDTPDVQLRTMQEVAGLLEHTINAVRTGRLDARVANSVALLAGQLQRCLERGDLERRIEQLEARRS